MSPPTTPTPSASISVNVHFTGAPTAHILRPRGQAPCAVVEIGQAAADAAVFIDTIAQADALAAAVADARNALAMALAAYDRDRGHGDSDTQPDPYIDGMAAEHGQEYDGGNDEVRS